MVRRNEKLAQLTRLAQLKSELELGRFAAFSSTLSAARQRIADCEGAVSRCYASTAPMSLVEARLASAEAGKMSRLAEEARQDLYKMLPRFEMARQRAAKEFGRATVLDNLSRQSGK